MRSLAVGRKYFEIVLCIEVEISIKMTTDLYHVCEAWNTKGFCWFNKHRILVGEIVFVD